MSAVRATQDEYGVVTIYEDGTMRYVMKRSDWDTMRNELGLPPQEPEAVVSGGGFVYGIERRVKP